MKNGIHPGISREDYNKIDALNISLLIEGERSMAHLKYASEHPQEATPAMEKGTALHLAIFEPSKFESSVAFFDGDKRTKEWKQFQASCKAEFVFGKKDFDSIIAMRDAVRSHERAKQLLDAKGTGEMGLVWTDAETGILCKGLLDRFCQCWGYSIILDLKSCQDARALEFAKTVYDYSYHTKCAWYVDGMTAIQDTPRRFLWLAVESAPYHGVCIHDVGEGMMQTGRRNYRRLLAEYKSCKESGVWPGYPSGEESLELPAWVK